MRPLNRIFGLRSRVLLGILIAGGWAAWQLQLDFRELLPSNRWDTARDFFHAALSPAIVYEDPTPAGTQPLLVKVAKGIWQTICFAMTAISMAIIGGVLLGFLSSSAWWEDDPARDTNWLRQLLRNLITPTIVWLTRTFVVLIRSIHELLWAILFLSAMGLNTLTAILAIAVPYTGYFAKVFSEIIDETPRDAAYAIRELGGSPFHVFFFGLLPRALPDMTAYVCYRFECALRSSAVMGFFGIPTIGYYLRPAFDEQHFHEVWTYLYALMLLIVIVDRWSDLLRRRITQ